MHFGCGESSSCTSRSSDIWRSPSALDSSGQHQTATGSDDGFPRRLRVTINTSTDGGSLVVVMRIKADWARLVVVVFTVAVFYAPVCSTTCAIGVCPNQVQQTASHDCDQASSHHSNPSGHQAPVHPDCSQHEHPGLFLAKSGDASQFQLSVLGYLDASDTAVSSGPSLIASMGAAKASDLAPPFRSNTPVYQQISVLRI